MNLNSYKHSFITPKRLLSSLSVYNSGLQQCAPGESWGPGVRDHYVIHYLLSGKCRYQLQDREYLLEAGSMFLVYPDQVVFWAADEEDPCEYAWVGFNGPDAKALLSHTAFTPEQPWLIAADGEDVLTGLENIYKLRGNRDNSMVAMVGALYLFLSKLMESNPNPIRITDSSIHLHNALDYIANNYSTPITVDEIAQHLEISRSMLYRLFMKELEMSPSEYLASYRIRRATQLFETTNLPVKTVSNSVGFDDPLYFSRRFKELTGKSPSAFCREALVSDKHITKD